MAQGDACLGSVSGQWTQFCKGTYLLCFHCQLFSPEISLCTSEQYRNVPSKRPTLCKHPPPILMLTHLHFFACEFHIPMSAYSGEYGNPWVDNLITLQYPAVINFHSVRMQSWELIQWISLTFERSIPYSVALRELIAIWHQNSPLASSAVSSCIQVAYNAMSSYYTWNTEQSIWTQLKSTAAHRNNRMLYSQWCDALT